MVEQQPVNSGEISIRKSFDDTFNLNITKLSVAQDKNKQHSMLNYLKIAQAEDNAII